MVKLKCWKKLDMKVGGPKKTYASYNKTNKGNFVWVVSSDVDKKKPFRVAGVNGRGYIKDEYFKNKSQAVKFANKYMKKHDRC